MRRYFSCLIILGMLSIPFHVDAQIAITNYSANSNAEVANAMVDSLVGDGVTFSNASFTGVRNSSNGFQLGYFQNSGITETEMGMTRGVTLTSGDIDDIPLTLTEDPGASNSFATGYSSSTPGEIRKSTSSINDMDVLVGSASWFNGAILEFDFVPQGDSIVFNYVFGGEEYSDNTNFTNYQCSPYNDKFGFLISGPGINEGAGYDNDARNIARLSNGSEVGINSVNDGVVGSSGSPNGPSYCSNENADWTEGTPSPEFGGTIQGTKPNGNTIVLNAAQGGLTPGQTYHIRLLIADVSDGTYDAVVYIEAGSFSSPPAGLTLEADPQSICLGESTYVVANTAELVPPITYEWSDGTTNTTSNHSDSILVAPTVNTTYSITVTDSDGGSAFVGNESLEITVNPLPTVDLGTDQNLCVYDVPITLDAGAAMSNYAWSDGSSSQTIDVSTNDTYIVTVTDGNGCTASSSMDLTVNPAPTVDLGADQTLCSYDVPITLDAGATMSIYTWSEGSGTQTLDVASSDTYAVTVTDGNGCTASSSMVLTVNPVPTVDLGGDQTLCSYNVPITLDAGAAMSDYNWSDGSDTQTLEISTSDTYSVTVTDGNGCTASSSMNLTVNPAPTVDLGGDQVICDYDNLMLDAGAGMLDYNWSTGDDTQTLTVDAEADYFVTVTASNGCTATDGMSLSLEASPTPDLGSNLLVCSYDTPITLNPGTSAVYDYNWSEGSTTSTIDVISSGTYEVTVSAGSCSATDQVDVTVNPAPSVDLGTDQTLCEYDVPITLDAGATMAIYSWSDGSDTQTLDVSASDTYAVTVTDGNGCTASSSMVLTVNPVPTVDLGADQALCDYDTPISLDAGGPFDVYNWSTGEDTQTINISTSDSYAVTVTNVDGCTATSSVIVDVNLAPALDLGDDISLCDSELPYTLNAGSGMSEYIWSTGNTQENQDVNASGNYAVTITDNNACTASDIINVDVQVSVNPSFTIIDTYCEGEQAEQLNATSENDVSGVWSPSEINTNLIGQTDYLFTPASGECANNLSVTVTVDETLTPEFQSFGPYCVGETVDLLPTESNNDISGSWTPNVISSALAGNYNYQFTPADSDACVENYSQSVVINSYPEFDVWISDSVIYSDNTVSIEVTGVDEIIWTPSDMLSCDNCLNPIFYANENQASDETYYFMLTADENGCQTTDSVFITVLADVPIHIPSGFSPNNDNIGDTWIIDGLIPFPDHEIVVFNRWGNMVYQASPYDNTWDGRNMNGEQLPAGTYYYVLKLNDKSEESFSGYIYIAY